MSAAFSIDAFLIDEASAGRIAWFAADLGIKASLGLLGALVITWAARRSSAALRHRVWFLAFCGLLLLPVLPLVVPRWQIPLPAAFDNIRPAVSETQLTLRHDLPQADSDNQIHRSLQPEVDPFESSRNEDRSWSADAGTMRGAEQGRGFERPVAQSPRVATPTPAVAAMPSSRPANRSAWFYVGGLMAVVWAAGAAVSLFAIFVSRRRGRQVLRSATPVVDLRWLEPFKELRESLRLGSRVTLLESPRAVVPMATGVFCHAVLLPRETEEWSTALRRHVLIHELAHVKRRDVLQHLISSVATALYWFHPLAWYGMRQMRLEREIACDDCVLMAGEPACDYAAELVGIARQMKGISTPWAVCMASGSTLEERVRAMLDRARSHSPMSARAARSLLIVGLSAIGLLAAVEPGASSVHRPAAQSESEVPPVADSSPSKEDADAPAKRLSSKKIEVEGKGDTFKVRGDELKPDGQPAKTAVASSDDSFTYAGTVVDEHGEPVAGAKILLAYLRRTPPRGGVQPVAIADQHGRFQFSRRKLDFADAVEFPDAALVALAEGHGFAVGPSVHFETTGRLRAAISPDARQWLAAHPERISNVLRMVADDVPVRGRILNTEGRPVVGAKAEAINVWSGEEGTLDAWEKAATEPAARYWTAQQRLALAAGGLSLIGPFALPVPAALTDADGWFTLQGLGRERIAEICIGGPGIESVLVRARSRRGNIIKFDQWSLEDQSVFPNEFSRIMGPSIPVEGRVIDVASGHPLAGITLRAEDLATSAVGGTYLAHYIRTETGPDGRYRLEGLPLDKTGSKPFRRLARDTWLASSQSRRRPDRSSLRPTSN